MKPVITFLLLLVVSLALYLHYSERFAYFNGIVYQKIGWDGESAEMFEKGCEAKNVRSCVELGRMYEEGDGVDTNLSKSAALYQKALELGYLPAKEHVQRLETAR